MTLAFMTHFKDGTPTYFVDKIFKPFMGNGYTTQQVYPVWLANQEKPYLTEKYLERNEKIHTIRKDKKNRWKAGNDIHFVVNNRTPERFQFAPVIKCVSVQEIQIIYSDEDLCEQNGVEPVVKINGRILDFYNNEYDELAINDGFESTEAFFKYFNEDFTGKLIHWTDKKY